jgi:D-cysteine desulfhydrase family pyridoxal phosphate-dependent enzyme
MRASWPTFPRVDLIGGPTPLQPAPRLSAALGGPEIWLKRDDLTALALGGNKLRKLELLIAEAKARGADVVVTAGAAQSNHCVQTAAACNVNGLDCVVVLRGTEDTPVAGNLLLDHLLGAEVRLRDMSMDDRNAAAEAVAEELREEGRRPVVVPVGGSNALGVIGYAYAAFEIADQARSAGVAPAALVCPSGSGGTQAGLVLGALALGRPFEVHGVSVRADRATLAARVARLASDGAALVDETPVDPETVVVHDGYVGPGYGELTAGSLEAIRLIARTEGVFVDPVYTGKALSGLIGEVRAGRWAGGEHVVFVHTGGAPALFAYNERLLAAG